MLSAGIVEDLVMNVFAAGPDAPLEVGLHANPALYDAAELQTHRKRLLHVLGQFVEDPRRPVADLGLLLPGESRGLAEFGDGGPASGFSEEHVLAPFVRRVASTPDAPALVSDDATLTYLDVAQIVERLAGLLAAEGVSTGDRVVVALDRSVEQVCAIYAVMALGAAYVPADPAEPEHRRAAVEAIVTPRLVVDATFVETHRRALHAEGCLLYTSDAADE